MTSSTLINITAAETQFMANTLAAQWAEDVAFGSGTALLPLLERIADLGPDGGQFDASVSGMGISPRDAFGALSVYDPEGYLTDADRDAFVARLMRAAGGAA